MVVILTTEEACSSELKALVKTYDSPQQLRVQTLGPVVLKATFSCSLLETNKRHKINKTGIN